MIDPKYIEDKKFYFCSSDIPGSIYGITISEEMSIQKGKYDYITAFMDYAIDSGLVFRDWMLDIDIPSPVNENKLEEKRSSNYGPLLFITIYKGSGLKLSFHYSPYEDMDYSKEYFEKMVDGPVVWVKTVRIDANWYYEYEVIERSKSWWPDPKELGFTSTY